MHTLTHSHTFTYNHTHIQTHVHTQTYTCLYTYTQRHTHSHTYTDIYTVIHHTDTCTRTYTQTHTYCGSFKTFLKHISPTESNSQYRGGDTHLVEAVAHSQGTGEPPWYPLAPGYDMCCHPPSLSLFPHLWNESGEVRAWPLPRTLLLPSLCAWKLDRE